MKNMTKKKRSSPYHPEGDGISECHISVMKELVRKKLIEKHLPQYKWTEVLPETQLAMNTKVHVSTRFTPFQLVFAENNEKVKL